MKAGVSSLHMFFYPVSVATYSRVVSLMSWGLSWFIRHMQIIPYTPTTAPVVIKQLTK